MIILGYLLANNTNSIALIILTCLIALINSIISEYFDFIYNWNYNYLNKTIKVYPNDSIHRKLFMSN